MANMLYEIEIFRFLFPVLTVVGSGLFFYFGMKGILHKRTISLFRFRYATVLESQGVFTGPLAVFVGFMYLFFSAVCFFFLGGISYFLILKMAG